MSIRPTGIEQWREVPQYVEAVQYLGEYSAGLIAGWVAGSGEESVSVEYVPRGHEHPLRPPNEKDRSRGDVLEDAPAFIILTNPEGKSRVDQGSYVVRRDLTGAFHAEDAAAFRKVHQHHSEYSA